MMSVCINESLKYRLLESLDVLASELIGFIGVCLGNMNVCTFTMLNALLLELCLSCVSLTMCNG